MYLFDCDHFVKHFRTICMMHLKFLKERNATKNARNIITMIY